MSDFGRTYRRVARRELHSSRATAAIVVAILLILVAAWIGVEIVIMLVGAPALLVSPQDMLDAAFTLEQYIPASVIAIGAVAALLGLILVVIGVTPGRRGRHLIRSDRFLTLVDDEVTASALSRTAARSAALSPDHTLTSVAKRRALVRIRPLSGMSLDAESIGDSVNQAVDELDLTPPLRASVTISENGSVGS